MLQKPISQPSPLANLLSAFGSFSQSKLSFAKNAKAEPGPLKTFLHLEQWQLCAPTNGLWMRKLNAPHRQPPVNSERFDSISRC